MIEIPSLLNNENQDQMKVGIEKLAIYDVTCFNPMPFLYHIFLRINRLMFMPLFERRFFPLFIINIY